MESDATTAAKLTTHQRDLEEDGRKLASWLGGILGADGPVSITDIHSPEGSGMSSVTILFTAAWEAAGEKHEKDLVARLAPDTGSFPVFPSYDFRLQYDCMAAMASHHAVPVPPLVGLEETGELLGSPCIVMETVHGRAPADNPPYVFTGWLLDATDEERAHLQTETARVVARVHEVPPSAVPSLTVADGDALRAHVAATRDYYDWTYADDGVRVPLIERTFDWLEAHWPGDPGEPVLSWGDARPGNILYDGFDPVAVLDWEMAGVAPRGVDVAWFPMLHMFFQDICDVFELPGLADFGVPEEFAAQYTELSGHEIKDLHWYVVYGLLRYAIVMARIKRRQIHFGEEPKPDDPDDYVMFRALLERNLA